jgi:hypothetical protein
VRHDHGSMGYYPSHPPPRKGPAFLLPAPWSYAISYVHIEDLRGVVYIRNR